MNKYTLWLRETDAEDIKLIGGKGAALAEMNELGLNIPNGFFVTSNAYSLFLTYNRLSKKIGQYFDNLDRRDPRSLENTSRAIKGLIQRAPMPPEVSHPIMVNYLRLGGGIREVKTAVRSSLINEYLIASSFLNIKGEANVVEAVKKCWSALFRPGNILKNKTLWQEKMAVFVQKMLKPRIEGIIYPKDKKELTIKVLKKISEQETKDLKKLGRRIQRHYFFPQKIKFAIVKNKIFVLEVKTNE